MKFDIGQKVKIVGPDKLMLPGGRKNFRWYPYMSYLIGQEYIVKTQLKVRDSTEPELQNYYSLKGLGVVKFHEDFLAVTFDWPWAEAWDEDNEGPTIPPKLTAEELKKLNMDGRTVCAQADCSSKLRGCIGFLYCPDCEG